MNKTFISADELLADSVRLAMKILESGFRPSYIVGVWRGGTPVGIAVQEVLEYCGIETDHIAIRTASYAAIDQQEKEVRVYGLGYLVDNLEAEDNLLIVDDVFDSGRSIVAIESELEQRCRRNMPGDVRVATVYNKPSRHSTDRTPEYYVHDTEDWLIFPHELQGLTPEEIRSKKPPALAALLESLEPAVKRT